MPTTSVDVPDQLDDWISAKVRSGEYNDAGEVFREALRLLKAREDRDELELAFLRQKVTTGLRQADRGEFSSRDIKQIIADGRQQQPVTVSRSAA